jgi:hypothetical protein
MRQHTSAYAAQRALCLAKSACTKRCTKLHTAHVSIPSHTSAFCLATSACTKLCTKLPQALKLTRRAVKLTSRAVKLTTRNPCPRLPENDLSSTFTLCQPHVHARAHVTFVAGTLTLRVLRSCRVLPVVLLPVDRAVYDYRYRFDCAAMRRNVLTNKQGEMHLLATEGVEALCLYALCFYVTRS